MAQLTTFVFTDLVGSVSLKGEMPGVDAAARDAAFVQQVLQPHRERIEEGLAAAEGRVVSTAGDGHFLVFPDTARAALWAIDVLRAHQAEPIVVGTRHAEVRIGIHSGTPQPDPTDPDNFIGRAVDFAARLSDHAQGGQLLVSRTTASLIEDAGLVGVRLHSHGTLDLKGIGDVELFELLDQARQPTRPRQNTAVPAPREWSVLPRTMGLTEFSAQAHGLAPASAAGASSSATAVRKRRLGNYELRELIGAGGMGNVYKAQHAQFERARAVKVIRPDLVEAGGDSVVGRFYQEVRATGSLEHPNLVVAIDSSSPEDEEHYLVMEYVDGVSLDELLRAEGPLPIADACEIARQTALGLQHLHEEGLVHRDVKPSNLMVTLAASPYAPFDASSGSAEKSGTAKLPVVKLMDLGLALLVRGDGERLTQMDRGGMGTGHYMSPEQWKTTSVDIRADIYSLGCTLYHLLIGEPPFARSDLKPERSHAAEVPPSLAPACGAPRELADLVKRMLAKRPEDRPQTPIEIVEILAPLAVGHRLAERITLYRRGGALAGSLGHVETRSDRAEPSETNVLRERSLLSSSGSVLHPEVSRWLVPALVTLVACGVLLVAWSGLSGGDSRLLDDKLTAIAGLTAREMASAIDSRIQALGIVAGESRLREWLGPDAAPADDNSDPLQAWLIEQRSQWDEKLQYRSSSWFVTDAQGVQIARAPYSPASMGESYARRDYFHGQGIDPPADPQPIREPHRSTVYKSTTANGELKVAFSTPIYSSRQASGRPQVLGVLAMSISLGEFAEFKAIEANTGSAEILLADTGVDDVEEKRLRGLVLHHRRLVNQPGSGEPPRLSIELQEEIKAAGNSRVGTLLGSYRDILGRSGETYLGAFAPVVPKTLPPDPRDPWIVIAQKRQE